MAPLANRNTLLLSGVPDSPSPKNMVGLGRLELPTPRLSSVCSNQLSYRPNLRYTLLRLAMNRDCAVASARLGKQITCKGTHEGTKDSLKEVIQPQVPLGLPCYDFTPVMNHTVVIVPLAVRLTTSGAAHSHGVTGGVYKARERIHRGMLIRDY
jgi:hypothetical protein